MVSSNAEWSVHIRFGFPAGHYLYADKLVCRIEGAVRPVQFQLPAAVRMNGKPGSVSQSAYVQPFEAVGFLGHQAPRNLVLTVFYQGCDELQCFFPEKRSFRLQTGHLWVELPSDNEFLADIPARWRRLADAFQVRGRATGYLDQDHFLRWLDRSGMADTAAVAQPVRVSNAIAIVGALGLALGASIAWRRRWVGWLRPGRHAALGAFALLASVALLALGLQRTILPRLLHQTAMAPRDQRIARQSAESDVPEDLARVLDLARVSGRPVFLDFWATWCQNCLLMDETTFKRPEVMRRLDQFVRLKARVEQPDRAAAREMLEYFGARGLPAYVILAPTAAEPDESAAMPAVDKAHETN